MSLRGDATSTPADGRAQRRWLIGLGITLVFGVFGAVMAVLAYTNDASAPVTRGADKSAPAPRQSTAPAAPDPEPSRGKAQDKDHGRK